MCPLQYTLIEIDTGVYNKISAKIVRTYPKIVNLPRKCGFVSQAGTNQITR